MRAATPDRAAEVRRAAVLAALALQVAVVAAAGLGAPFELRMPLAVAYVFTVPGFALVGLLRLADPVTEAALSVAVSIAAAITAAQVLVWAGAYSLAATLAALAAVTVAGLLAQLARPPGRRPGAA